MSRRRRILTPEESKLWDRVRATAKPLHPEKPKEQPEPTADLSDTEDLGKTRQRPVAIKPPKSVGNPNAKPLATPLDRKTVRSISRGHVPVEKRLDLHGMTQTHAHRRLKRFLEDAQIHDIRTVLVITGKGAHDDPSWDHTYQGRGVLRRSVPEWLRSPDFRGLVSGFSEAGRRHGGGGALYIRVKRRS